MSLPTARNDLSKVYEPKARRPLSVWPHCGPPKRLVCMFMWRSRHLPECDESDLRATLKAVAELEPITIFHEPINIRAENVARIEAHARALGVQLKTEVLRRVRAGRIMRCNRCIPCRNWPKSWASSSTCISGPTSRWAARRSRIGCRIRGSI